MQVGKIWRMERTVREFIFLMKEWYVNVPQISYYSKRHFCGDARLSKCPFYFFYYIKYQLHLPSCAFERLNKLTDLTGRVRTYVPICMGGECLIQRALYYSASRRFGIRFNKGWNDSIHVTKKKKKSRKLHTSVREIGYLLCRRRFSIWSHQVRLPFRIYWIHRSKKRILSVHKILHFRRGVQEGRNVNPSLFNIFLDYVLRIYENRCD